MGAEAWRQSMADLLRELGENYNISAELLNGALELDKAYIPTRYPNAHPSGSPRTRYTKEEGRRLIEYAERIIEFCSNILSKI
jgi:HEPN domain-containing protein